MSNSYKYLVTWTVTVESEDPLSREEAEDRAWDCMNTTHIEPSIDNISNDPT